MRPSILLPFSALLAWISFCEPLLAGDTAAAEALFRSAREAADQGDWVTACDRFEESKRLEPAPGTVLNLARCREKLGQTASAWKSYEEAAERLPERDDRAAFARRKARELSPRVPRLTLHAPDGDVQVTVLVRDTELSSATFGVPLPFDPGSMTVVVRADGHKDFAIELALEESEALEHQLILGPALAAEESGENSTDMRLPDTAPEVSSRRKTWGYTFLAMGGVGVVATTVGAIWAGSELPKVNDHCESGQCDRTGADAASRGRTAVVVAAGGSALTLIGLGIGGYLLLTPKKEMAVGFAPVPGGGILTWRNFL